MKKILPFLLSAVILSLLNYTTGTQSHAEAWVDEFPRPQIEFNPFTYLCTRTDGEILIDGETYDDGWSGTQTIKWFIDIDCSYWPEEEIQTSAHMKWDNDYLYILAGLREKQIWATLTERDSIIFHDNDFEVFIDPDGDTHNYFELEINALNTVWDLLLVKPYRDGGPALHQWDIPGLKTAVSFRGTRNDPSDIDSAWCIEIAIPWAALAQGAGTACPPNPGDRWRMNFSRVEWDVDVVDGEYVKRTDPETGNLLPEHNWVWSPQGLINMHYPEMWGIVEFTDETTLPIDYRPEVSDLDRAMYAMRQVYYAEREYQMNHGEFTTDLSVFGIEEMEVEGYVWSPSIEITESMFEARLMSEDGKSVIVITQDGRVWEEEVNED